MQTPPGGFGCSTGTPLSVTLKPVIRRDYILRMIEEFIQTLARISALKRDQRWQEAGGVVDEEFQRLIGAGAQTVARLTETELLARLIRGEPTQAVHDKTLMLTALLKEAGDVAARQERAEESLSCYSKGLHLLLETLAHEEVSTFPDFVPRVEMFTAALRGSPLTLETQALLIRHYERSGEYAKAEDALFAMLEAEPANPALVGFGVSFYERLQGQSDASLAAGNLPRPELEASLAELRARKAE
jgi:hypothetical protein